MISLQTWEDAKEVLNQTKEGDSYNLLMRDRIDDFVKFWIFSLEHVKNEGIYSKLINALDMYLLTCIFAYIKQFKFYKQNIF